MIRNVVSQELFGVDGGPRGNRQTFEHSFLGVCSGYVAPQHAACVSEAVQSNSPTQGRGLAEVSVAVLQQLLWRSGLVARWGGSGRSKPHVLTASDVFTGS